ncbi:MAG: hypothetical protein WCE54_16150 [Ignavibacteriaceae bacterium]
MKNILMTLSLLFAILIVGCKENSVEPPLPNNYEPLMPISVGNYWLYQGYYLNSDGSVNSADDYKFGFIIDDTISQIINGNKILNYKLFNCGEELKPYYDKPGSFEGSKLIYQNKNGIFYAGDERYDTIKITFNDLVFPYTVEKGKTVSGHVFYYSTLGNISNVPSDVITDYICISTDSLFTTPLGDFQCIVYRMAYDDYKSLFRDEVNYFIKPGIGIVGMVQMIYFYNIGKYHYLNEYLLTNYKIKEEKLK